MTQKGSKTLLLPERLTPVETLPTATAEEKIAVLTTALANVTERLNALIEAVQESHAQSWGDVHDIDYNTLTAAEIATNFLAITSIVDLSTIAAGEPTVEGLYLTPEKMGFHDGSNWRTYFGYNGNFQIYAGGGNYIANSAGKLVISTDSFEVEAGGGDNIIDFSNNTAPYIQINTNGHIKSKGKVFGNTTQGWILGYSGSKYVFEIYIDANNYFRYDGSTALDLKVQKVYLGNATDYLSLNNGSDALHMENGNWKTWLSSGGIATNVLTVIHTDSTVVFEVSGDDGDDESYILMRSYDGNHSIIISDIGATQYQIDDFVLKDCVVGTTENDTGGALKYASNHLYFYNGTAWKQLAEV